MGVNSYVFHGDKSIKSSQKCGGISSVPRLPLFATFKATTEHKIIKILNYDLSAGQQTLLGVNSYNVFDDDKSIKSDSKIIKPWRVLCLRSLSTILFHFSGHCGVRSPKVSKCKCSLIELYNGNWYHWSGSYIDALISVAEYPNRPPDHDCIRFSEGPIMCYQGLILRGPIGLRVVSVPTRLQ